MPSTFVRALWPGLALAVALLALVLVAPDVARAFVREDGLVEWLQVSVAVIGLGFVAWSATLRFSPVDVLAAAMLIELVIAELDLDRRITGVAVFDWRFLRRATVPIPVRALMVMLVVAFFTGLLAYTLSRRRALWREVQDGFRQGWMWLLVLGVVLFGIPQPCERCMDLVFLPVGPHHFLEESLELLGLLYIVLALMYRGRHVSARRSACPTRPKSPS